MCLIRCAFRDVKLIKSPRFENIVYNCIPLSRSGVLFLLEQMLVKCCKKLYIK
ncbi:MAG: hypothetical protein JWO58_1689 [Chitinophagaceae bacterium]|nr:hypothetical protein [Chitinophagaceae bacterium]